MRITKRIENCVTNSVHEKYQPLYDKLEEPINQMYKDIEDTKNLINVSIKQQMHNILKNYYSEEDAIAKAETYHVSDGYYGRCGTSIVEKEINPQLKKLREQESNAVNDILLELEFGGSKDRLDELIAAVNPKL